MRAKAIESGSIKFMGSEIDGFFSPFMFAAGGIATSTGREVNGWDTTEATIESPQSVWLRDAFSPPRPVLNLSTQVFPALGVGQKSQRRTLLEIREAEGAEDDASSSTAADRARWEEDLLTLLRFHSNTIGKLEDDSKLMEKETAEVNELLARVEPAVLDQFSLKQFRDASDPDSACYQSIVRCPMAIDEFHDSIRVLGKRVQVRIHRYPNHPIIDDLGLVVASHEITEDGCNIACLELAHGYYVQVDLRTKLADNLCWRAGSTAWSGPPAPTARTESAKPPTRPEENDA